MKRVFVALLAVSLGFVFACEPAKNANVSRNENANQIIAPTTGADRYVQIYIHDAPGKPGYYDVEEPDPVTLHTKKKQRIVWCVYYDGSLTPPSEVVIDTFRTPPPPASPTASNPFGDGSASDNTFTVPSADFSICKHGTKTPKTDVVIGSYKYMITAKVGGEDRGHLDPQVIINE